MALRLITDHVQDCTRARQNTASAIKDVRDILLRFIGGVIAVVVIFAGYTYAQQQSLAKQLEESHAQQAQQIEQIPDQTIERLGNVAKPAFPQ